MSQYLSNFGTRMDPVEALLDPVNKLRVTTPQNLIDTDFEYSLQSFKWETVQLSNNIPSFYISDSTVPLRTVTSVTSIANSFIITVTTSDPHGLAAGTPIDAQGLSYRTAEGAFLIQSVPSQFEFTYKAKSVQTFTGAINGVYTVITPGSFYAGSQITYDPTVGMTTDVAAFSKITVTTPATHGFNVGASLYLVNSIGTKQVTISSGTTTTASDGRPVIDFAQTLSTTITPTLSLTETKAVRSTHYKKIDATGLDVVGSRILWATNNFRPNDCVLYVPSAGDVAIGGLARYQVYYVQNPTSTGFQLSNTYQGSPITFSAGATFALGRHAFHMVYEIMYMYKGPNNYETQYYTAAAWNGAGSGSSSNSGWDLQSGNGVVSSSTSNWGFWWGLGQVDPGFKMIFSPSGASLDTNVYNAVPYSSAFNPRMAMPESTLTPSDTNWIEDWDGRWNNYYANWVAYQGQVSNGPYTYSYGDGTIRGNYDNQFQYNNSGSASFGRKTWFLWFGLRDEEADTLYAPDHKLIDGSTVSITVNASSYNNFVFNWGQYWYPLDNGIFQENVGSSGATSPFTVSVVSANRFKLVPSGSSQRRLARTPSSMTIAGTSTNALANTFFSPNHGYSGGETVTIETGSGGALPSTPTGAIVINSNRVSGNMVTMWTVSNSFMNNYVANTLSGSGVSITGRTDTQPLYLNGYGSSNNVVLSTGVSSGQSSVSYFSYPNGGSLYDQGLGISSYFNANVGLQSPTTPYDSGTGQATAGLGFSYMGTAWSQNTTVPHYSSVYSYTGSQSYADYNHYYYLNWNYNPNNVANSSNNSHTAGGSSDWRTTWMYWSGTGNSGVPGFVTGEIALWKDSWNGDSQIYLYSYNYSNFGYIYSSGGGNNNGYKFMKFQFSFMLQANAPAFDSTAMSAFVNSYVNYFANNFQYPVLSNGSNVRVKVLTSNRFSLENTAGTLGFALTSAGTAPIAFKQRGIIGALDGSYDITSTPSSKTFRMDLPFQAPDDTLLANVTTIGTVGTTNLINIPAGHFFAPGAVITYTVPSGSAITGLTANAMYYAYVQDNNWIGFATSYNNAITRNLITISQGSATGTHGIKFNLVNGQALAKGKVDVTLGSQNIEGDTDTLFSRFFKVGDTITLKQPGGAGAPGTMFSYTIAAITDDSHMTLTTAISFTATDIDHFVTTKIYVRPDAFAIHRPYDGGVEISAGSAPSSQIVRQTRKYFHYQSGKGIQTSLAINFNPPIQMNSLQQVGVTAYGQVQTRYPHKLRVGQAIKVIGSNDQAYNGAVSVYSVIDDYTFTYPLTGTPSSSIPSGIAQYTLNGYTGAFTRCGLFDFQNGFFFEYDGTTLYCVRRSSVEQLSGTAAVSANSSVVTGTSTNFVGQVNVGQKIVIRGSTYKVVEIASPTSLTIQPQYKGVSAANVIITKTVDTRVPQSQWSIDPCDGTGRYGYNLDLTKIQMTYMDYSWYGAGKIRFGFRTVDGEIKYVHDFIHNNTQDFAYMRSGNVPARYEIENGPNPTYVPTLFHWGTSIIMDGRFDADQAYKFTASSNSLAFTNGATSNATTTANSQLTYQYDYNTRTLDWYVALYFNVSNASKFSSGTPLYTGDLQLNGNSVDYTTISGSTVVVYVYLTSGFFQPVAPNVPNGTVVSIGAPAEGSTTAVNLGTALVPLISIRLAPSADSGLTGALGEREVINRIQLKLAEVGMVLTHDCQCYLILNGNISSIKWNTQAYPSLSQLQQHSTGDTITGGVDLFSFRASGGLPIQAGLPNTTVTSNIDLTGVTDMGNAILGGNGAFPNGPDVLTVAVKVADTSSINSTNPFKAAARITWTEI